MEYKGLVTGIIIVALLVGAGWFLYATYGKPVQSPSVQNSQQNTQAQGTLYFSFTDAAMNMQNVTAVDMQVDKVAVHSQARGWITVSQTPQTFKLLELKEKSALQLSAKVTLAADTYDQIRFHVTKVTVTESGAVKEAKMPSSEVKINSVVKVKANTDSSVVVDILADESLHKTGKGEIIFAPVAKVETREGASLSVGADNMVTVEGGIIDTNITAGMDVDGSVKDNFKLKTDTELEINGDLIKLKGTGAGTINLPTD